MTAAYACFWFGTEGTKRRGWSLTLYYVFLALAMMAKAPLPLVFVALPLGVWWFATIPIFRLAPVEAAPDSIPSTRKDILRQQCRRVRGLRLISGTLIFLAIFAPWPLYIYSKYDNALDLWRLEFLARYSGALSGRDRPFWYYVPLAFGLVFPFSLSLPEAVSSVALRRYASLRRPLLFALTWLIVPFVFLSTAAFKRPHYLIGCLPAMALLLAPTLHALLLGPRSFSRRGLWAAMGGIALIATASLGYAHRMVATDHQQISWALTLATVVVVAGAIATAAAFLSKRRTVSLIALLTTMMLTFAWTWSAAGRDGMVDARIAGMVSQLRAHAIRPDTRLIWVTGRPDSRLAYYHGIQVDQLFSTLELAPRRKGRQTIPSAILSDAIEKIRGRIQDGRNELFVIKGQYWDRFKDELVFEARELFRVQAENSDPRDDWVVIAQPETVSS